MGTQISALHYGVFEEKGDKTFLYYIAETVQEAGAWLGRRVVYDAFGVLPLEEYTALISTLYESVDNDEMEIRAFRVKDSVYYVSRLTDTDLKNYLNTREI